jgi:ribonuclease D
MNKNSSSVFQNDLPNGIEFTEYLCIDSEAMGLNFHRDRLCLLQIADIKNNIYIVKFDGKDYRAPNLRRILSDEKLLKIFHFARFDVGIIYKYLDVLVKNIYCTKIASKLARTYTDSHGLKELCRELLGLQLSKVMQSSDWGSESLSDEQLKYAASDVLNLAQLKLKLDKMLIRESRYELAVECFKFLPHRAALDVRGWSELDIFAH